MHADIKERLISGGSFLPELNKDIRWQQRFANFRKALSQLRKFVDKGELTELEEQGAIQAFEYTYELGWLVLKDFLEYQGLTDIFGSRDAIRKAFQAGLIEDGETCETNLITD